MTIQQPSSPIPADPSAGPLNLVPSAANAPAVAAAAEKVQWTGKLEIGPDDQTRSRMSFSLITRLSALDMVIMQEAQDSGSFRKIIEAVPRLVVKSEREQMIDYLLSDPDDDRDRLTLDNILEALSNGLEQISNRPTDR